MINNFAAFETGAFLPARIALAGIVAGLAFAVSVSVGLGAALLFYLWVFASIARSPNPPSSSAIARADTTTSQIAPWIGAVVAIVGLQLPLLAYFVRRAFEGNGLAIVLALLGSALTVAAWLRWGETRRN